MNAAALLVPLLVLGAAAVAGAPPLENGAEAIDMGIDLNAWTAVDGNAIESDMAMGPAWMASGAWVLAGVEESGASWYVDATSSDFRQRPMRVVIRVDESPNAGSPNDSTQRVAEIDCAKHRYRILGTTRFDDDGRRFEEDERGDGRLVPIVAGSIFQAVELTACERMGDGAATIVNGM